MLGMLRAVGVLLGVLLLLLVVMLVVGVAAVLVVVVIVVVVAASVTSASTVAAIVAPPPPSSTSSSSAAATASSSSSSSAVVVTITIGHYVSIMFSVGIGGIGIDLGWCLVSVWCRCLLFLQYTLLARVSAFLMCSGTMVWLSKIKGCCRN